MRILVLGANGFIGSAIVAALLRADMIVRCAVRQPDAMANRFPGVETVRSDLRDEAASDPAYWRDAVSGVDAVVNVAGVLPPRRDSDAWSVHCHTPDALFAACETAGVRRVIQLSAVGVEEAETVYARSKRAGDEKLMARDLDWTVLRPADHQAVVGGVMAGLRAGGPIQRSGAVCGYPRAPYTRPDTGVRVGSRYEPDRPGHRRRPDRRLAAQGNGECSVGDGDRLHVGADVPGAGSLGGSFWRLAQEPAADRAPTGSPNLGR